MENNRIGSNLVYSTLRGSVCPACSQALDDCVCRRLKKKDAPEPGGVLRLRYEKARKGKGMTLINGLALHESGLLDLARKLKQRFGCGGSVKDRVIELQGDFRKQAEEELRKMGLFK